MRSLDSVIDQPIDRAENLVREAQEAQGLVLPCNVVLRGEGSRTSISTAHPRGLMDAPALAEFAEEAPRESSCVADDVVTG